MTTTPPPPEPTDDEIRVRIAEACGINTKHARFWYRGHSGWKWWEFSNRADAERTHKHFGTKDHPIQEFTQVGWLPSYLTNLNAMAEAEMWLRGTEKQFRNEREYHERFHRYLAHLNELPCGGKLATARQRALAFLATINGETQ